MPLKLQFSKSGKELLQNGALVVDQDRVIAPSYTISDPKSSGKLFTGLVPDNYSPSKTHLAFVHNHRLSWRHCPLWLSEFDFAFAVIDVGNRAGSIGLAITNFSAVNPIAPGYPAIYPGQVGCGKRWFE